MQIDMHYYGLYVLARLAGVDKESAEIIATSSQFVDDSYKREHQMLEDGHSFKKICTAHHMKLSAGLIENINDTDQRLVWVPFHFIPGGKGENLSQKLVCKKDSDIANEMIKFVLKNSDNDFGRELLGIALHGYMDTFSHFGFSGVSSRINKIENNLIKILNADKLLKKYLIEKFDNFTDTYSFIISNYRDLRSFSLESITGALGHGAVSVFPDIPYLKWEYKYEKSCYYKSDEKRLIERNNTEIYMEAIKKIFKILKKFIDRNGKYKNKDLNLKYEDIKNDIEKIISAEQEKSKRCKMWIRYLGRSKKLEEKELPVYSGNIWNEAEPIKYNNFFEKSFYKFHSAAEIYRTYMLRELLPKEGINLI